VKDTVQYMCPFTNVNSKSLTNYDSFMFCIFLQRFIEMLKKLSDDQDDHVYGNKQQRSVPLLISVVCDNYICSNLMWF